MHSITINFEEIPTINIDGREGGLVDGGCDVDFDSRDGWEVGSISIELHTGHDWKLTRVSPIEQSQLYAILHENVSDRYAAMIEAKIDDYFTETDGDRADARRERMRA